MVNATYLLFDLLLWLTLIGAIVGMIVLCSVEWWRSKTSIEYWKPYRAMGERMMREADDNIERLERMREIEAAQRARRARDTHEPST